MSKWTYSSCPQCGSSDALAFKEGDEWGYCFSCNSSSPLVDNPITKAIKPKMNTTKKLSLEAITSYDCRGFKERGITKTISEHYGVKVSYSSDGTIISHFYPYTSKGKIVAYKERKLPKDFTIHGDFKDTQLFGQNVSMSGKLLVITEGELDALAVAQAQYDKYKKIYPAVAIPSASQVKVILEQRDWLRSFETIVLMFDSDEPGQKATAEAAKIIGYDKVKIAKLPEKDPCDVLIKHGSEELMRCIWNAQSYSPAGIVRGEAIWNKYLEHNNAVSTPYPDCLKGINDKLKGMRMGEIVLFTSGTGSGKSTVIKEIVLDILKNTTDMVGMVSLEESVGDTAQKFIGMVLEKDLKDADVSDEEQYDAFKSVFGDERLVLLDHQGSVADDSLLDKMEHLALMGCKYIILDHITIAVSEGAGNKTGNEAVDSVMSDLLKLTKKHNIWLGVISHLRKGNNQQKPFEEGRIPSLDDIKGSGSIKQISFDIIGFARNMVAESDTERNTIRFRVLKARYTGNTGDAGSSCYNPKTGRLSSNNIFDFQ
jgi:twinkle protein